VQTCYERRLKDDNLLQGSMKVLLTIGSDGNVKAVSVGGTLSDRQVYNCVKRIAKTWKFPPPQDGCVRTEAPFQMMPKP
jgi:outer membrane biosynthesis protein TonB